MKLEINEIQSPELNSKFTDFVTHPVTIIAVTAGVLALT